MTLRDLTLDEIYSLLDEFEAVWCPKFYRDDDKCGEALVFFLNERGITLEEFCATENKTAHPWTR